MSATAESEGAVAILFADLGGSTALYARLGDERAREVTSECLNRFMAVVHGHGGSVVKTIGDEVMATFPEADAAAAAACGILLDLGNAVLPGGIQLGAHVGFHWGHVIRESGDVFGDAVNVAARIVSLAKEGEILTTRQAVEALSPERRSRARQIDRRSVKGRQEQLDIFEIVWRRKDLTMISPIPTDASRDASRLVLSVGEERLEIDAERTSVSIGRDPINDIVLRDPRVSRRHAHIQLSNGKFVLRDESSNGTTVKTETGKLIALHREDLVLQGSGALDVTPAPGGAPELRILYSVEG